MFWSVLNHTVSALCLVVKYVLVSSVLSHTASALSLVVKYVCYDPSVEQRPHYEDGLEHHGGSAVCPRGWRGAGL